jgi:shikimate kinase
LILKLKRAPGIYLVGFMGSGKSTVGPLLANEIGWRYVDLDERIEAEQGRTIADLFEADGEPAFRDIESNALRQLIREVYRGRATVSSLGGGAFAWPGNREKLEDCGVTIWLDAPFDLVQARTATQTHRPLAKDPDRFRQLYQQRREAYARADYRIEILGDEAKDAVNEILGLGLLD